MEKFTIVAYLLQLVRFREITTMWGVMFTEQKWFHIDSKLGLPEYKEEYMSMTVYRINNLLW